MKILHIDTGKEWRGGQRQALLLHTELLKNGFDSFLACNVKGELINHCEKRVIGITYRNELDILCIKQLIDMVTEFKPDVIHAHDAHALTPAVIVAWIKKVPLVHTRRVDFSINRSMLSKLKYSNKHVTKLVAISEAIKNVLINDGIPESKLDVINSGVPAPHKINQPLVKKLKSDYDLKDDFIIGTVANFAPHKDHKTLLNAFELLYQKNQNVKLVMVGDGPLYDETIQHAKGLSSFEKIVFTGHQTSVYEHIELMELFTMSSSEEGLCTSIIDALNCHKPVVATKAGGIPELVKHNHNGLLSDVKNEQQFAENMFQIMTDTELKKRLSKAAKPSAEPFSAKNMAKRYMDLYTEISKD